MTKIPAGIIITSATFNTKVKTAVYSGSLSQEYKNLEIHNITESWSFNSLQYGYPSIKSDYESIIGSTVADNWSVLDVTDSVKKIYGNTAVNYGWLLKHQSDGYSTAYTSERMFYTPTDADINNRPYIEITYTLKPPAEPIPTEPIGLYKDKGNTIRFAWSFDGVQSSFLLSWTSDNGTTWHTVTQATGNKYYDMSANILPEGNILWKVKVIDSNSQESPESTTNIFYAVGAPSTPTITSITVNTSRPNVAWNVTSQQVYQLQILSGETVVYDTGNIADISVRQHKVTSFLQDYSYTARIKVKNEFDLASGWGTANFVLSTTKPAKPGITVSRNKYNLTISSAIADNSYLLLYRADAGTNKFICIARSTGSVINDYTVESNKKYQYFVRAVSSDEAFADSDTKIILSPVISQSIISSVYDLSNIFEVKYNHNENVGRSVTIALPNSINYFSGREYPIIEFNKHKNTEISLSLFIKGDSDMQQLMDIINAKSTILYRDGRRKLYGSIAGLNSADYSKEYDGYNISFNTTQTDYSEELEV